MRNEILLFRPEIIGVCLLAIIVLLLVIDSMIPQEKRLTRRVLVVTIYMCPIRNYRVEEERVLRERLGAYISDRTNDPAVTRILMPLEPEYRCSMWRSMCRIAGLVRDNRSHS